MSFFRRFDWPLLIAALLLSSVGLVSIYSSSLGRGNFFSFEKQIVFLGIGAILMFFFSFFDYRALKNPYLILLIYALLILALGGLFLFAPGIRGVRSWYKLGPLSFDPTEFLKIALILLLAKYFSSRHIEMYKLRHIFLSGFYIFLPAFLIYLQPDLGSALILLFLWLSILLISGVKLRHFLAIVLCGILLFIIAWNFVLKDYQKARIISFLMPEFEPFESGWSQKQAKIAIGSGGLWGKGLGKGSQVQYGFLPEPKTDFIFAAIAEEFGFATIFLLLLFFFFLFWRILKIAAFSRDNFSRLFASGFGILLAIQFFINIGSNIGLAPVIGIPLPFVSCGGSSLLAFYIGLGILQNIKANS
jgi:rod shape determining protein RodA